jgi:Protein of unknown function (DUF4240)
LCQLPADQIAAFDAIFRALRERAGTAHVWSAGLLLNGGHGSDDGFEYFRNWLISRGRATFERALHDPDSLADEAVPVGAHGPSAEFESYGYAAGDAYLAVAGEGLELGDLSQPLESDDADFDESAEALQRRVPRLWSKYGELTLRSEKRGKGILAMFEVHTGRISMGSLVRVQAQAL